jgi:hypothetical protein
LICVSERWTMADGGAVGGNVIATVSSTFSVRHVHKTRRRVTHMNAKCRRFKNEQCRVSSRIQCDCPEWISRRLTPMVNTRVFQMQGRVGSGCRGGVVERAVYVVALRLGLVSESDSAGFYVPYFTNAKGRRREGSVKQYRRSGRLLLQFAIIASKLPIIALFI